MRLDRACRRSVRSLLLERFEAACQHGHVLPRDYWRVGWSEPARLTFTPDFPPPDGLIMAQPRSAGAHPRTLGAVSFGHCPQ